MSLFTAADAHVYIGTTADASDETDFAADTYTEITPVETIGDFGDQAQDVTFTGITDSRTQHVKGSTDAGTMQLTCAWKASDAGQIALKAAFDSPLDYNFKVVFNDPATVNGTGTTVYFRGKVMSFRRVLGTGPNNVIKLQANVGINSDQIEVAPT